MGRPAVPGPALDNVIKILGIKNHTFQQDLCDMNIQAFLRRSLSAFGHRFPQASRYSGRLGLGRLLAPPNSFEQVTIDNDVRIELDLSIPAFRGYYYLGNLGRLIEVIVIQRLLRPDDVMVDVGANIGYVALIGAKHGHMVYAFEPSKQTFQQLSRNVALNPQLAGRVQIRQLGLSDGPGILTLHRPHSAPTMASLQPMGFSDSVEELVNIDLLDNQLPSTEVNVLKIDVEGAELHVLRGAQKTIDAYHPVIFCELVEAYQERFKHTSQQIVRFMYDHGYTGYRIGNKGTDAAPVLFAEPLGDIRGSTREIENALFVHAPYADQVITRMTQPETR